MMRLNWLTLAFLAPLAASAHPRPEKPDYYEKIYDATLGGKTGDAYFREMNVGWQTNIGQLRASLDPRKNYLVLHVIEPDFVYDLRTGEDFRSSLLAIGLPRLINSNVSVGHAFLSWRCQVPGGVAEGTTGFTGELDKQFTKMMRTGWGMTSFYSSFDDGHLQTPRLLDFEFNEGHPIHTVAIEVGEDVCHRTLGFVRAFVSHPSKPYENFGPNLDPLKFQGGGCGSFVVSTLQAGGLFGNLPIPQSTWRTLRANRRLFGYGLKVPEDAVPYRIRAEGRHTVSLVQLFLSNWNDHDGDGPAIRQQDPELYLLFLKTLYRLNAQELAASPQWAEFRGRTEFRMRQVKIHHEMVTYSGSFDEKTAEVVRLTQRWMDGLKQQGYHARMGRIGQGRYDAIILDR